MNRPWMPLYVADYRADTAHLNAAQHGAYLLLIMHYWQTGNLPSEDEQLARIACMTTAEWKRSRSIVVPFFGSDWKHKRIDAEIAKAELKHDRRVEAGKRGGIASVAAKQNPSIATSNSQPSSSQPESERKKETDIRSVAVATRPGRDENFEELRRVYPKREGSNPKEPARKLFVAAVKAGTDPQAIIAGARSYAAAERERLGTPFIAQLMTWLRQRRWEDYATTGPPSEEIPAHLRPPPGMPSLEELRAKDREKLNGAAKGTEVRSGPGLGENGSDRPAEL